MFCSDSAHSAAQQTLALLCVWEEGLPVPRAGQTLGPARCTDACPSGLLLPFNPGPVLRAGHWPPCAPLSPMTITERTVCGQLSMAAPAQHPCPAHGSREEQAAPCSTPSHSENGPAFVQSGPGEEAALL